MSPTIFEELIAVTGAETVEWSRRLECCGHPPWEKNNELSLRLMKVKLADAGQAGAAVLCTACTYCQIQFDTVQATSLPGKDKASRLPAILYPQLLGVSMNLPEGAISLKKNLLPVPGNPAFSNTYGFSLSRESRGGKQATDA